jgi:hypothetical protein
MEHQVPDLSRMDTLVVDDSSSEQMLALARTRLEHCTGLVVLNGVVTLRPWRHEIECAVTPIAAAPRCEEEYKVLVENAARALGSSELGRRLPQRPLRWVVVDDDGSGAVELWRAP